MTLRWLGLNVLVLAAMLIGLQVMEKGPAASDSAIDAQRAMATLRALNPDELPHPSGSPANIAVRDAIRQRLTDLGYQPELQARVHCTPRWPGCTAIENVIARKRGTGTGADAILVTAHYDSVPGGPGAADDLAGVAAILEVAGEIRNEAFRNDIIFLFSDGEETGLRGAMAFAGQHPALDQVRLVLNLEARGAAGPSVMFETSEGNARLISLFASGASRPVANSLMFEIYRLMSNNSDMTVYKEAGAAGLNFAFYRHASLYHSSRDSSANLSARSLAHHGDNVLTVLREAAGADLSGLHSAGNATYVDVFGRWLLYWPGGLNLPASAVCLVIIIVTGWQTGAFRRRSLLWAGAGMAALIAGLLSAGWLLSWPLGHWPGLHPLDHPFPWPARIALGLASVLAALIAGRVFHRRAGEASALCATWTGMALLSLVLSIFLPTGAYILLLPVLVFALGAGGEVLLLRRPVPVVAGWAGLTVAAYMSIYHFLFFEGLVLNYQASHLMMLVLALSALPAAALAGHVLLPRQGLKVELPAFAALLLATGTGRTMPAYTPERPRAVNLAYVQDIRPDGLRQASWRMFSLGSPDDAYVRRAGFPPEPQPFDRFGARPGRAHFQEAPAAELEPPVRHIISQEQTDGMRVLRGIISPGRNGPFFGISFPAASPVARFIVEGTELLDAEAFLDGKPQLVGFSGIRTGLGFELHISSREPVDAVLFEISEFPDLAEGREMVNIRSREAASIHFGDHTEILQHIRL